MSTGTSAGSEAAGSEVVFSTVEHAAEEMRAGRPVVVVDDQDRENEGDLIFAATLATPELVAFMVRYTSGFVCAPMTEEDCDRLELPPMAKVNQDRRGTAYTVTVDAETFVADVMAETLRRSALGRLRPGDPVNLERAATLSSRLGGHLVQGHVDGVGTVTHREPGEHWEAVRFAVPAAITRYVVEKGSIAVDGVSLTVMAVDDESVTVGLIPTTLSSTTLGVAQVGAPVNLEVDILAKYVEKLILAGSTA